MMAPDLPAQRGGLSLERKLPLWISLLLLAVVATLAWASYAEVRLAALTAAQERLKRVTAQLADLSAVNGDQRAAAMRVVAADRRLVALLGATGDQSIDSAVVQRLAGPVDSALVVELRDVSAQRRAGTAPPVPEDSARAAAVARAVLVTDSVRNGPLYERADSVFFWSGAPVQVGRRTAGVLLQRRQVMNSERAERQIRNLVGGRDVMVYIANTSNDLWVTLLGKRVPVPAGTTVDSAFEYVRDGRAILASGVPVRGGPWAIITEQPLATVMQRPHDFLRRMAAVLVLIVVAGAAAAWVLSRHVTRPLVDLRAAAESVAAGGEPPTLPVSSGDELGLLSASFNAMAERVRASRKELQQQVSEARTLAGELEQAQTETLRAARQMGRLQAITAALSSARTPEEVATVIVEQGISAVDAHAGSICVLSEDGTLLEILRAEGYAPAVVSDWMHFPITLDVPLARVIRTGEPEFIVSMADFAARYTTARSVRVDAKTRSWAALPLMVEGRTLGAMGLSFAREGPFSPDAQGFMRTLAQQCAQALDRSRLYQAERAARHEAEEARTRADEARRAAEAANQAKSDFLATMSHELRTPLNAIGGYTELIEMGLRGSVTEEQRQDLQRIRKSQTHLLNLINDVLHFAKLDAGRVEYDLQVVPLDEMIDELEPFVAPQIGAKGLRYEHRRCDEMLAARADREKVRQILLNLLSNAVKFTAPGGAIEVGCEARADAVLIAVRDTGVGVPPERIEAIFDPFFQVDRRLTRSHDGIGLGLAISRDLARGMGGELSVRSAPDQGSIFTLELPRAAVTEPSISA